MKRSTDALLGLVVVALGVLWLLNNMDITHVPLGELIGHWWPVILVYFGISGIADSTPTAMNGRRGVLVGSLVINAVLLAVGVMLLGNNNNWFHADLNWIWGALFPLVIILAGVSLLFGGLTRNREAAHTYWAVLGGANVKRDTWQDTSVVAVMGGAKLDLTQAGLPEQEVLFDVQALMGGVEIWVPEGVAVTAEWTGFMGGVTLFGEGSGALLDQKRMTVGQGPQVRIRARTIMGGVDVKHRKQF